MMLIKCTECGQEISEKAETCPNCGNPVEKKDICDENEKAVSDIYLNCPDCGKQVSGTTIKCPQCGRPLNSVNQQYQQLYQQQYQQPYIQKEEGLSWYLWVIFIFTGWLIPFIYFLLKVKNEPKKAKQAGIIACVWFIIWLFFLFA